jgi:hypothetical protein
MAPKSVSLFSAIIFLLLGFLMAMSWFDEPSLYGQEPNRPEANAPRANQPASSASSQDEGAEPVNHPMVALGHNFLHAILGDRDPSPGQRGSPYVPLDSWIYPAIDRLAAMNLIGIQFSGMRPWTRAACAQMVSEAQDEVDPSNGVASEIVNELAREFQPELEPNYSPKNTQFRLESIYSRTERISGQPLTDGYNFAQTQYNDFGRPFGEGWNTVNGFSGYATHGRWVVYVRGEGQTAPSMRRSLCPPANSWRVTQHCLYRQPVRSLLPGNLHCSIPTSERCCGIGRSRSADKASGGGPEAAHL